MRPILARYLDVGIELHVENCRGQPCPCRIDKPWEVGTGEQSHPVCISSGVTSSQAAPRKQSNQTSNTDFMHAVILLFTLYVLYMLYLFVKTIYNLIRAQAMYNML